MKASPIDPEEAGATGTAYGEFGPIELDPQAKQSLESVLGTGGSQFPVSIMLKSSASESRLNPIDERVSTDEEADGPTEGRMFVNQHLIKICFDQENDSS